MPAGELLVRRLGRVPYAPIWQRMKDFVDARDDATVDELWLLEHDPVYTLGLAGDPMHVLDAGDTPVVKTDRGGQVTWHGPGQLVAYVLLDMRRRALGPRELVRLLEEAVIRVLAGYGLRIRRHASYHGLALNVAPDLSAFRGINPCGYAGLTVTSLAALGIATTLDEAGTRVADVLSELLDAPAASPGTAADNP